MKRLVPYTNAQGEEVRAEVDLSPAEAAAFDLSGALPLAAIKNVWIEAAWAEMERRLDAASVTIETSAGTYAYGIDADTQNNLAKVLLGVVLGITPNPRPWTPKGETTPIAVTHSDLTLIGGTVGGAYDAMIQAYLAHKAAIMAAESADQVFSRDLSSGWPY